MFNDIIEFVYYRIYDMRKDGLLDLWMNLITRMNSYR